MSVAANKWSGRECWSADGLLLPTDEFIPLEGSPARGYQVGPAVPLANLTDLSAGEWIEVDTWCQCEDTARGLLVEAGGGPSEGEGYVTVTDAEGGLVWVLHLCESEGFTKVSLDGNEVVAVAEEYPARHVFRIPVGEPHRLHVQVYQA